MKKKRTCLVLLLAVLLSGAFLKHFREDLEEALEQYQTEEEQEIDFTYWQGVNPDVCAWIRVPGTKIDYPVVQGAGLEDSYYLTHDIYQDENIYGAIFIENSNRLDFTSPNTIIYGHHMKDGSMFGDLTQFEERDFFDKHSEFTVYLPDEVRLYKITAAYRYPAEHLLAAFDFDTKEGTEEYCRKVPGFAVSYGGYAREGVELRAPFVTLSTCTSDNRSFRFLVQGRLEDVKKRQEDKN